MKQISIYWKTPSLVGFQASQANRESSAQGG